MQQFWPLRSHRPSVRPSIHPPVSTSVCPSVHPSICPSIHLSICLSVCCNTWKYWKSMTIICKFSNHGQKCINCSPITWIEFASKGIDTELHKLNYKITLLSVVKKEFHKVEILLLKDLLFSENFCNWQVAKAFW